MHHDELTVETPVRADSAPAQPQTQEESLAEKQKRLQEARKEAARLNQEAAAKQAEVKQRQKQVDELTRSLDGYQGAAVDAMQEQLDDALREIEHEQKRAVEALKDKAPQVTEIINKLAAAVQEKEELRAAALAAAEKADDTARDAEKAAAYAQTAYEAIRNAPKATEDALKDLTGLLDQAAKAKSQGDYPAMHFLLLEAEAVTERVVIEPAEDYEAALIAQGDAAHKAKLEAAAAAASAEHAADSYADAKKQHDAASNSYRTTVLKALKDIT